MDDYIVESWKISLKIHFFLDFIVGHYKKTQSKETKCLNGQKTGNQASNILVYFFKDKICILLRY